MRENETIQVTLAGKPGDRVWLRYSTRPGTGLSSPFFDGEFVLASPHAGFFVGTLPPSGSFLLAAPAFDLAAGVESAVLFVQSLFRDVDTGRLVVSSPSTLVVLDAAL